MSYFVDSAEAVHLAASEDGLHWDPLDRINPVLSALPPITTLRDPFIAFGLDGLFHLLATNAWASTSIVHASSANLVDWSEPRLIPVMSTVRDARNAWAPEFFVDEAAGKHIVIWSSAIEPLSRGWRSFEEISNQSHDQRIWSSETVDFREWSEPSVWFDPGYSVIDATVLRIEDRWLLAFKDERGRNEDPAGYKGIRLSAFDQVGGPFEPPSRILSESLVEGPTFIRARDTIRILYDYFFEDRYGGIESSDCATWSPIDGLQVPPGARHASALLVPEAVFRNLMMFGKSGVQSASNNRP